MPTDDVSSTMSTGPVMRVLRQVCHEDPHVALALNAMAGLDDPGMVVANLMRELLVERKRLLKTLVELQATKPVWWLPDEESVGKYL